MSKTIGLPKAGKCRHHPVQAIDRIEFLAQCGLNTSPEFKGIKTSRSQHMPQISIEYQP